MRKVNKITKDAIHYNAEFEDGNKFDFEIVFDGEWVLQGVQEARYCQSELMVILKEIAELNQN